MFWYTVFFFMPSKVRWYLHLFIGKSVDRSWIKFDIIIFKQNKPLLLDSQPQLPSCKNIIFAYILRLKKWKVLIDHHWSGCVAPRHLYRCLISFEVHLLHHPPLLVILTKPLLLYLDLLLRRIDDLLVTTMVHKKQVVESMEHTAS